MPCMLDYHHEGQFHYCANCCLGAREWQNILDVHELCTSAQGRYALHRDTVLGKKGRKALSDTSGGHLVHSEGYQPRHGVMQLFEPKSEVQWTQGPEFPPV